MPINGGRDGYHDKKAKKWHSLQYRVDGACMDRQQRGKFYKPAVMVDSFFINKLCFHVNPMSGGKHRMIYEKTLWTVPISLQG